VLIRLYFDGESTKRLWPVFADGLLGPRFSSVLGFATVDFVQVTVFSLPLNLRGLHHEQVYHSKTAR
jgi:hypothetical protein